MRVIYICYECKKTLELEPGEVLPEGWTFNEHLDGFHFWLCDTCSPVSIYRR